MTKAGLYSYFKQSTPARVRAVLRGVLTYAQRLSRWLIVLRQVRGSDHVSRIVLWRSAGYAPVVSARHLRIWKDPELLADCDVVVPSVGAFRLRARSDDLWHVLPWRERAIVAYLRHTLKPGDTFVDAGANIGFYTVLGAKLVGSEGRVIAIEMMPDTAERLTEHVGLNRLANVSIVRAALADTSGGVVEASVPDGRFGQASIANGRAGEPGVRRISVQTQTLDELLHDLPAVRLLKMDLEGAELPALRGARNVLSRIDAVVYESWGRARASAQAAAVDRLIKDAGYSVRRLDGNDWVGERAT